MKKITKFIKKNVKLLIGLIIGFVISGGSVYAATILYQSSNVGFNNTSAQLTKNGVAVDNVQDAIEALSTKIPSYPFKLGDYFTLVPDVATFTVRASATGYTSDQTINIAGTSASNGLRLWRVIDIHKDGSVDAVSEYVSADVVYFKGTTGYQHLVATLQLIASQYAKSGYTIGTRMMGYGGQTPVIQTKSSTCDDTTCQTTTTYAFDGSTKTAPTTTTTPDPTTGTGQEYLGGVGGDTLYLKDYLLVTNVYGNVKAYKVGTTTYANYWLASRRFYWYSATSFNFNGRYVNTSGSLSGYYCRYLLYVWTDNPSGYYLRPIITLKSGVTTSGGSGTKESPYTLS